MLQVKQNQMPIRGIPGRSVNSQNPSRAWRCRTLGEYSRPSSPTSISQMEPWAESAPQIPSQVSFADISWSPLRDTHPGEIDPLYLFMCGLQWESEEEPSAGWELIAAAQSSHSETRAQARALLASSRHLGGTGVCGESTPAAKKLASSMDEEEEMKTPYGIAIVENCADCPLVTAGDFCAFSQPALASLSGVSQRSIVPAGAILLVEGQAARGIFILCSGKVNLSTTSKDGKNLILKTAGPGEALGLSASVSSTNYETTAETVTPCLVNFIERKHFLELMQTHNEMGLHTAQWLSLDYQTAYRDIHDLVLTRSSAGKLARLLLSQAPREGVIEGRRKSIPMTHREMAMRIGASRETVTRLLSDLRKKQLIQLDGPTLVIRDRTALESMAV